MVQEVDTKKALVTLSIVLALLGVSVLAASWQQDRSGVPFKVDSKTGSTQIGFYLFMNYNPVPNCIEITVDWSVYPVSTPQSPLATDSHRIRRHCGGSISSVSTLSPFVTPVPGMSYAGKIVLHNAANNLTYEKQITYVAPITLPTGIGINVTTPTGKTEEIDFSGINDEQLKSLTTYYAIVTERLKDFQNDFVGSVWLAKGKTGGDAPQVVFMDKQA